MTLAWTIWLVAEEVVETAVEKEGGLFDFDATLPLMALQFLLLAIILNAIFYRPLTETIDKRADYIRENNNRARESISKSQRLAKEFDDRLKEARRAAQETIANATSEAQQEAAQNIAAAQQEVQQQREEAAGEIEREKQAALQTLEQQVDDLSRQILDKLVGAELAKR